MWKNMYKEVHRLSGHTVSPHLEATASQPCSILMSAHSKPAEPVSRIEQQSCEGEDTWPMKSTSTMQCFIMNTTENNPFMN